MKLQNILVHAKVWAFSCNSDCLGSDTGFSFAIFFGTSSLGVNPGAQGRQEEGAEVACDEVCSSTSTVASCIF